MARYIDADELREPLSIIIENAEAKELYNIAFNYEHCLKMIEDTPTADVAPRAEVFEEVDKFRTDLMNKFIDLCRGNDYNKLTLLKIGDVVDEMYDRRIAELKKKYTEDKPNDTK